MNYLLDSGSLETREVTSRQGCRLINGMCEYINPVTERVYEVHAKCACSLLFTTN